MKFVFSRQVRISKAVKQSPQTSIVSLSNFYEHFEFSLDDIPHKYQVKQHYELIAVCLPLKAK